MAIFAFSFPYNLNHLVKFHIKPVIRLDPCDLVGWALSCKVKGCQFDSGSGHMPRSWVQSPGGHVPEATN